MPGKSSLHLIKTPEGIVFSQSLAGPVVRFAAWAIDVMVIAACLSIVGGVLSLLKVISLDIAGAASALAYFVVTIGYGTVLEWRCRGQTLGKRMLRLRVVDVQGLRLQPSQVVIRNLLRFVDSLPLAYFVGGLAILLSRKCQRLGDLAANTVVIHNPEITEPNLDQILAGKFNSLRAFPHLVARLRQRVSPPEAAVALQALLRRDQFDPAARVELFREIAAHFRAKVEFPPETSDGITDEQYVRNVADVLYRTRTREPAGNPAART